MVVNCSVDSLKLIPSLAYTCDQVFVWKCY